MNEKDRTEFFQLLRLKLDEIEDIMESYGGKEQFMSLYCFGVFVPETEENPDRYEMMAGMHMAMEDEFDLMSNTVKECFRPKICSCSSIISNWLFRRG